jgi:hypothetical protein
MPPQEAQKPDVPVTTSLGVTTVICKSRLPLQITLGVLLIASAMLLGWVLGASSSEHNDAAEYTPPQQAVIATSTKEAQSVLIYSKQVSSVDADGRGWPVLNIYRKVGNEEPELLVTVGAVHEYPAGFALSPDQNLLVINLETKLQILNLTTKELKTVATTDVAKYVADSYSSNTIGREGVVFSPDSTKVAFVHLGKPLTEESDMLSNNTLWIADLVTGKNTQLMDSSKVLYEAVHAWLPNDVIIVKATPDKGGAATQYRFVDVKTALPISDYFTNREFTLSDDGRFATKVLARESFEVCGLVWSSEMGGDNDTLINYPSVLSVVDPRTGAVIAEKIGTEGKVIEVVALSPDQKDIVYRTFDEPKDASDCALFTSSATKLVTATYYQLSLAEASAPRILDGTEYKNRLAAWKAGAVNAALIYGDYVAPYQPGSQSIVLDGVLVVTEPTKTVGVAFYSPLQIIGQFYW